ncbi:MAG: PhoH family protein [Bacillota bacterium]|nr:PhoH family protein [Bacillota bacterium]MDD3298762.1 PhoH family protein [Bacillota bacterium]MDD3850381.1 PhoH family protein [Bacillota bacterium]MDD4708008.1 PhoH family protein [Bacillota bacterium]
MIELFGNFDENVKMIEERLGVDIIARGNEIKIKGAAERTILAERLINNLIDMLKKGEQLSTQNISYAIGLVMAGQEDKIKDLGNEVICLTHRGKQIRSKTLGQKIYIEAMKKCDIVFSIGPAGTGKTYLAIAMAVSAMRNREVTRIILTRPAVEAGEKLGFLPGDLQDKVDPYLRPLYDALYDILGGETYAKYRERGVIEVAPLAYMRGRTLDDSFIILDEAQNTTPEQMKMFLTRMGFGSKIVVTGDITQIDLPTGKNSGLVEATKILKGIKGLDIVYLTEKDVVRHHMVQKIILAYDRHNAKKAGK